ncbi:hypothetical protein TNCV_5142181 [Trichonephila clavipes]|nr:hypothetical protein TNCV_5142181 [Trichonephila clavipes]
MSSLSSAVEDSPCRGGDARTICEGSNVFPLVWCVSLERGLPARVSSSSLDYGSERRPSPIALVKTFKTKVLDCLMAIILNNGQVTSKTPELAPPSPNFHSILTGGRLILDRFHLQRSHGGTRLELMTCRPRVRSLDH